MERRYEQFAVDCLAAQEVSKGWYILHFWISFGLAQPLYMHRGTAQSYRKRKWDQLHLWKPETILDPKIKINSWLFYSHPQFLIKQLLFFFINVIFSSSQVSVVFRSYVSLLSSWWVEEGEEVWRNTVFSTGRILKFCSRVFQQQFQVFKVIQWQGSLCNFPTSLVRTTEDICLRYWFPGPSLSDSYSEDHTWDPGTCIYIYFLCLFSI